MAAALLRPPPCPLPSSTPASSSRPAKSQDALKDETKSIPHFCLLPSSSPSSSPSFSFAQKKEKFSPQLHIAAAFSVSVPRHISAAESSSYSSSSLFPKRKRFNLAKASMGSGGVPSETAKVLVPIANGTEEMEATIIIDVLRRAGAEVTVASVEEQLEIVASRRVKLRADCLITACADVTFDLIALPGGMPGAERLRDSEPLKQLVARQAQERRTIAAICAAPAVALHSWGLLEGKKATAHPAFASQLADVTAVEQRVVEDGGLVTSRGPGTAFEFALALVENLYGREKAEAVAAPMVMRKKDGSDVSFAGSLSTADEKPHSSPPTVLVPIAHGTEEMEAVIVIDVLRRAGADVSVASVESDLVVVASRRVNLVADVLISDVKNKNFDLIVIPGGMPGAERLRDNELLVTMLKQQKAAALPIAAICAAPAVVLQTHDLFDEGARATGHPGFVEALGAVFLAEARVVADAGVVTSRGPGTAFEFALVLVQLLLGAEAAQAVALPMVMEQQQLTPAPV
eukprot:TRINITY_DN1934_c0_g2_i2.p1 TRINITY_DN1934_c0_g2~~TRINITY_DN1934_c0_g2_i2.p1  ORF type:complete len:517 (-),score=173.41 TRINITY_DN1934_c0_g2_i2:253-1803(-)